MEVKIKPTPCDAEVINCHVAREASGVYFATVAWAFLASP